MSDLRVALLTEVRKMAEGEMRNYGVVRRSYRKEAVANRLLSRLSAPFAGVSLPEAYVGYVGGMMGPFLKEKPENGNRCGVWTAPLMMELADAYRDVRAEFLLKNPMVPCPALAVTEDYAEFLNSDARAWLKERGLLS